MATYTAEQTDELIRTLEKSAERQHATMNSAVKGVAAERDLLSIAEKARDLLEKAVKGEKELLNTVFGANDCKQIGRFRYLLDTVQLSDMHVKDQRWRHLREVVESIEAVLKDLGTFKPWVSSPRASRTNGSQLSQGSRSSLPHSACAWRLDAHQNDTVKSHGTDPREAAEAQGSQPGKPSSSLRQ
eukprot:UN4409